MEVIDDNGQLFGAVNVVDALVVLLVVAVVVAGAALVLSDDPPEGPDVDTTHATLDVGTQPEFVLEEINEGDTYSPGDNTELTIQDVHLAPEGDQTRVIMRVAVTGERDGGTIEYEGAPPRLGRSLDIITDQYQIDGQIRAVGEAETLTRDERTVVVRDTVDAVDAREIAVGDPIRAGGRTVATVDAVESFPTADPEQRTVFLETTLQTYQQQERQRFGDTAIQRGQSITLPGDGYTVSGSIERRGTLDALGTAAERTVTLRMEEVDDDFATALRPGMAETVGGDTIAEITDVSVSPSVLIVTGDDGSVNVADHPVNRDVTLTANIQVRQTPEGPQFKGNPLRQRQQITLDLGTTVITAEVVSVR